MITHLEPDILECEVKWALGSIKAMNKASGGDGIPVDLFQILKDDAVKVLHSVCQQIWKLTIPKKKKCKKAKWLSEEALQVVGKRREAKGKGEKERYPSECRVPKKSKER